MHRGRSVVSARLHYRNEVHGKATATGRALRSNRCCTPMRICITRMDADHTQKNVHAHLFSPKRHIHRKILEHQADSRLSRLRVVLCGQHLGLLRGKWKLHGHIDYPRLNYFDHRTSPNNTLQPDVDDILTSQSELPLSEYQKSQPRVHTKYSPEIPLESQALEHVSPLDGRRLGTARQRRNETVMSRETRSSAKCHDRGCPPS